MNKDRRKLKIQVLYGGNSSERPGSILSSKTIEVALRNSHYQNVSRVDVTRYSLPTLISNRPDLAFLTLHGGFGEDGSLQGFLDILEIPYTSSGVAASMMSTDKVLFSRFVSSLGYKVPKQFVATSRVGLEFVDKKYPKVIKPAMHGCSYGVFLVQTPEELRERAKFSLKFGGRVVIEDYIPGREFAVGLFKSPQNGCPEVLPIAETKLIKGIFDFETKYPGGEHLYETIIPAKLATKKIRELEKICSHIFAELGCKGYAMMDVRLDHRGNFYVLENNTIPGMLNPTESYIPRMLRACGLSLAQFVDMIVESTIKSEKPTSKIPSEKEMVKYLGLKLAED